MVTKQQDALKTDGAQTTEGAGVKGGDPILEAANLIAAANQSDSRQPEGDSAGKPEAPDQTGTTPDGTPASDERTFSSEEELTKYVDEQLGTRVQSEVDKKMTPLYEERDSLKAEVESLKTRLEDKKEDAKLAEQVRLELEELGDEAVVKTAQELRKQANDRDRASRDREKELDGRASNLDAAALEVEAGRAAVELLMGDKAATETYTAVVARLKKATTAEHLDDIKSIIRGELAKNSAPPEKPARPVPDKGNPTVAGGFNPNSLSKDPTAQIQLGLEAANKK